jgi:hypothetical protein
MSWIINLFRRLRPPPKPTPQPPPQPGLIGFQLLAAHNAIRIAHGLSALVDNPALALAAQKHSDVMASINKLGHDNTGDGNPIQRAKQAGYNGMGGWENVAQGQFSFEEVMKDWAYSPGHLSNILNPNHTDMGGGMNNNFWTVDFGTTHWGTQFSAAMASMTRGEPGYETHTTWPSAGRKASSFKLNISPGTLEEPKHGREDS